jgi:non-lysosomal glucosylceramidase
MPQSRRQFLRHTGLSVIGLLAVPPAFARGWRVPYPLHNIPVDKGLDPAWVKSLYERGKPSTYLKSRNDLQYIGMPAGGLHSGTLYLGGDGRLWLWGIYNDDREGVDPKEALWNDGIQERKIRPRDGANYVDPPLANNKRVLEQGFALRIIHKGHTYLRQLREEDFQEVSFEATYPLATVRYTDPLLPVSITLTGGAFYIPLNADDSALPATHLEIEIINHSADPVEVSLTGWLENGVRKISGGTDTKMIGELESEEHTLLSYTYETAPGDGSAAPGGAPRDSGTMAFGLMNKKGEVNTKANPDGTSETQPDSEKCIGSISTGATLKPGDRMRADYVLAWHFNHTLEKLHGKMPESKEGYYYAARFKDAASILTYIAQHFGRLSMQTRLWQQTYYDSTLPHWLLERAIINVGTIATANTYRFASGRFWGWEGVNSCEGTCTHVWQYGHALARLFPSIERDTRQRVDLGVGLMENGGILFRGEFETSPAIDGQAGTILRFYREHQMSKDDAFLKANWDKIKRTIQFLMAQDKNGDGLTDTPMENTLDAVWDGEIAWIAGLSIAAIRAAQYMAVEAGDEDTAERCKQYVVNGCANMDSKLFNGEYFIHRPDPSIGRKHLGGYNSCHIDQVYGQSWAFQVGLGRLWSEEHTLSALRALWKYNFAPDVGPYIRTHTGGRPYALEGEAGLIMNTNPHNEEKPYGEDVTWQLGYFHECMSGFEHQVAAHMMSEGMTDEALVLTRAIHDRYHGSKRNPYNEIECSDHYARAMASYGTFISACGFTYHGPKGHLGFAPKISAKDFRAPFTAAEGWGTIDINYRDSMKAYIKLAYGQLRLKTLELSLPVPLPMLTSAMVNGNKLDIDTHKGANKEGGYLLITFKTDLLLKEGQSLDLQFS